MPKPAVPRRRFPPPWRIRELEESSVIEDDTRQPLAYVYFEDQSVRQSSMKRLSRDEARRITVSDLRIFRASSTPGARR